MKIALVGNQNCGKTTLFNSLTGSNQKVGNWAGVTVEKKIGIIKGTNHTLIDLPGIYSLTPYTTEEEISFNYIVNEKPDLIINLIDVNSIERSLFLTTQLIELNCKIIVALNMSELLEKQGHEINENKLSSFFNVPCIKINAQTSNGLNDLINLINASHVKSPNLNIYSKNLEELINEVTNSFSQKTNKFYAIKVLEQNSNYVKLVKNFNEINKKIKAIEKQNNLDIAQLIINEKYNFIEKAKNVCLTSIPVKTKKNATYKIDKILLNKYLAIPIFILIMALIYFFSVGVVGKYSSNFISLTISKFSLVIKNLLTNLNASSWAISLVCNGIIAGVGSVLTFLPQLIILFFCICLLETTGYMSRISFILDKLFYKIGLSGKSLIPFIVGSGCSVPAILSTRPIENEDEKQTTIMLTPFIPCSAKLPIIALFGGFFFKNSWLLTTLLYLFSILLVIISSYFIRKIFLTKKENLFIFELPNYKKPNLKYVVKDVTQKTTAFIKRAGSVIFICSIIVWFLVSFDFKLNYNVNIENSMLAKIGKAFSWVFYPILNTFSWGATVSAIQGLVAKEQVVSSLSVIAGVSGELFSANQIFGANTIFSFFTPVSAIAYLIFNLYSAPCFGAISAMKKELNSTKKTLLAISFQTLFSLTLATIAAFLGNLITILF